MAAPRRRALLIAVGAALGIAAVIVAAVLAIVITSGHAHPSESACKAAMKAGYAKAITSAQAQAEPSECKGLPSGTLTRLATEVMGESAPPSGNVTACRQFASQVDFLRGLKNITAADAAQIENGITSDQVMSTGKLNTDFTVMYNALTGHGDFSQAGNQVRADCAALGVST